jgi:glycosyltransferase involved in cell wall biosynthesis
MNNPWEDVAASGRWLLDLEQKLQPDVVHLNGYAHGALPFAAPIVVVAHSCVLSWWQAVKGVSAPREWSRYEREVARGVDGADVVVAPTRAMLDAIIAHYGPQRSTRIISNGRDASLYRPAAKKSFILTAGRLWDEAKNIAALQSIASEIAWPICIAGEERSPDGATQAMSQDVIPLGKLDPRTLANWFGRADIYALPARYEPFGLSALEAALSECALVLGDIPSLREVWGDAAFFVSPDDPQELRDQLQALIEHDALRRSLARRAKQRAQQYSLERMGEAYRALYLNVLRQRGVVDAARPETTLAIQPGAH